MSVSEIAKIVVNISMIGFFSMSVSAPANETTRPAVIGLLSTNVSEIAKMHSSDSEMGFFSIKVSADEKDIARDSVVDI